MTALETVLRRNVYYLIEVLQIMRGYCDGKPVFTKFG